jgi:hypothetical protein
MMLCFCSVEHYFKLPDFSVFKSLSIRTSKHFSFTISSPWKQRNTHTITKQCRGTQREGMRLWHLVAEQGHTRQLVSMASPEAELGPGVSLPTRYPSAILVYLQGSQPPGHHRSSGWMVSVAPGIPGCSVVPSLVGAVSLGRYGVYLDT